MSEGYEKDITLKGGPYDEKVIGWPKEISVGDYIYCNDVPYIIKSNAFGKMYAEFKAV